MHWEKVGDVSVESGTLVIEDNLKEGPEMDHYFEGYGQALLQHNASLWPASKGFLPTSDGQGIILGGFGGDGEFPVYIKRDKDGLIAAVLISFSSAEVPENDRTSD